MTKICMIGNSHAAAMRLGWDLAATEFPGLDVMIFGAHARNLVTAQMADGGKLVCDGPPFWFFTAGQEPSRARNIKVHEYDAFVIVGCDFGPMNVFRTFKRYHFAGLKSKRPQMLSRAQFTTAVSRAAGESAALLLGGLVKSATHAPVFLVPAPFPAENGFVDHDARQMEPYIAARHCEDAGLLLECYGRLEEEVAAKGYTLVRQAEATKASAISTLQIYSEGSVRLRADDDFQHGETDYFHMNALYGQLMWREIAAAIGTNPD